MRHPGFFPQLGKYEFCVVARLRNGAGCSRRRRGVDFELKVPCGQCFWNRLTKMSLVREELQFPVHFLGQSTQCRGKRLLVSTEVFRCAKVLDHRSNLDKCKTVIHPLEYVGRSGV